MQVILDKLN